MLKNLIIIGLVAAFAVGTTVTLQAQDKKAEVAAEGKKDRAIPFRGNINEIDKSAKTITIGKEKKRTFHITAETKIQRNGKEATLEDAAVGDEVGGSYREKDGKLQAASLRLGAKPEAVVKVKPEKKEK